MANARSVSRSFGPFVLAGEDDGPGAGGDERGERPLAPWSPATWTRGPLAGSRSGG